MTLHRLVQGIALAAALATTVGCTVAPTEATGSSHAKLLAPRPLLRVTASAETRAKLGVAEWRMFGGKGKQVITGYDAKGKARSGVEVQFKASTATTPAHVVVRHLDGSGFSFAYDFKTAPKVQGTPDAGTKALLQHAVIDIRAVLVNRAQAGNVKGAMAALTPVAAVFGDCGDAAFWSGLSGAGCGLAGYSAVQTGGLAWPLAGVACSGAAWYGADAYNKCKSDTPATPADPNAPTKEEPFCDPGGSGFCTQPTSSNEQTPNTQNAGDDTTAPPGTPSTTANATADASGMSGGVSADDAASATNQAGNDASCSSCTDASGTTMASDIQPSADTGDVQLADNAADTAPSDPSASSASSGDDVQTASFRLLR